MKDYNVTTDLNSLARSFFVFVFCSFLRCGTVDDFLLLFFTIIQISNVCISSR